MNFNLQCRSCGSTDAALILDLGLQPLANNLLTTADLAKPEPKFPLRLAVCQSCWLLLTATLGFAQGLIFVLTRNSLVWATALLA